MRVEEFLRESARKHGRKEALITNSRRLTYDELDDLSERMAWSLAQNGVGRDDRVVIFMENIWEAVVSIFAALKVGATFSPINATTKTDKLAYILQNCRAKAVITQSKLSGVAAAAVEMSPTVELTVVAGDGENKLPFALSFSDCVSHRFSAPLRHGGIDMDLAMLIYTSGSTGRPKGVMMTHRNMEAAATSISTYIQNVSSDIILNVLPIAFDYGLYQLIMSIKLGATLVLEKSFAFPQAIFAVMRREHVTGLPLVPTMAALILQMKDLVPGSFPDLRYITNTAAALPPSHIAQLRKLFPDVRIYSMYGLTECKRCTYLPPEKLDVKPDSVGIAIPNTEAFVVDDDGKKVPSGVIGELVIRGPHVMQGYWEDDEATRKALRPGPHPWERVLYTGDLFRADEDGYLYFVGRKDDIIKTRGEKVAPKEVEAVIHACPGVIEAVVVGVHDPILGQALHAIVVAQSETLTEQSIIRHCAAHLEDYMVPKSVVFRMELPKTDTGKVSRRLAAETLEQVQ
ncbi:class I adenylate-forming enzyme family protein [Microvirga mediterraneensis]|uniref:Acyl--CoA ligase n=1 Tax=Microvirga mediterraneensis TaxID=2754695 RepID=A0A838BNU0_9HYPH|nr:class I adenylate-forming enzyme family protein [Microvirga mediterraneensis]MBA1157021.1 acyl--CoA ligase [Microvirga mediterraneensis]